MIESKAFAIKNVRVASLMAIAWGMCGTAFAAERVIYDVSRPNDPTNFRPFLENPSSIGGRPGLSVGPAGLQGQPGQGNFTAWEFAELTSESWTLKSTFEIPAGARYVNSGFYLVHADPKTPLATLDAADRAAFEAALAKAQDRRSRFGEGPFELDFFSHEMQIIAGTDASVPVENRGAGAFYGIDVGNGKGQQQIPNPYGLFQGTTYELTLVNEGLNRKTYLRAVGFQAAAILVSE